MASPGDSSEKNVQEQEQGQDAGEGNVNAPVSESPQQGSDNSPTPIPTPQVEGGYTSKVPGEEVRAEGPKKVSGASETVFPPGERKRGRKDEAGASASGEKKRKKGELLEIPNKPPSCYVCGRSFQSWKAVFGHMRAHKIGEERARGAFPPPVFTPSASPEREQQALQEQLAPTLLNIAQDVLLRPQEVSSAGVETQEYGSSTRGLGIDLNLPQASPHSSASSSPNKDSSAFDLNMPPPEEGGDDDAGAGAGAA